MIKKLINDFFGKRSEQVSPAFEGKHSYSQCGEDVMCAFVLGVLGITDPLYLDIGCFDATKFSNTYHFYEKGRHGICVDANPILTAAFSAKRPRDQIVNIGLSGKTSAKLPFHVMEQATLSTFSNQEALRLESEGASKIERLIDINVFPIAEFLRSYFPDRKLDLVSLDVEGFDAEIVENFDFDFVRPAVFCVETLEYKERGHQKKNEQIINMMLSRNYMLYGDTFINSIFVDKSLWQAR